MKYDFTSIIDRKGKDATAVDNIGKKIWGNEPAAAKEGFDTIPMWVADMNFATAPAVVNAITQRLQHPIFGYYVPREEYFDSIIGWAKARHGVENLPREVIGHETSVHGLVTTAVEVLSEPGDGILLNSPRYVGFSADVEDLGRRTVCSELVVDDEGIWRMDFEDMDAKLKANNIHLAIFCSPHNPTGRVWERWELEKAFEVFAANECYVICDEIWADLFYTGHKHIPAYTVNDWAKKNVICVYGLGKTFNLAGFSGAYHIIFNKYLRDRIVAHSYRTHFNEMHMLSQYALIGAYSKEGQEWADELLQVLEENSMYAYNFIKEKFDGIFVAKPQGTYMIYLDCTEFCKKSGISLDDLLKAGWDVGVGWQDGRGFLGPCHIRMNLASPMSRIQEAFDRLDKYVFNAK